MSDDLDARTVIGAILGIIEVSLLFGMLYAGLFGLTKEAINKLLGG